MLRPLLASLALLALAACATAPSPGSSQAIPPGANASSSAKTRVLDAAAADRLRANQGVTLQWIGWNDRGSAHVTEQDGTLTLRGAQAQPDGPGRLFLDGTVTEIGADYFLFDGTIRIADTPDAGRKCEATKVWRFAVTQNRPYWRMREFEWCDNLTDYIDIYF